MNYFSAGRCPVSFETHFNMHLSGNVRGRGGIMPADVPPNLISSEKYKVNYKRKRRLKLTDSQVTEALEIANGNRRKAAEICSGLQSSTLYRFFDRTEIGKK